jgi:succinoglycan biosynthesis transport protein ExoP
MANSDGNLSNGNVPSGGRLVPAEPAAVPAPYGYGYGAPPSYGYAESEGDLGLYLREYWRIAVKRRWVILSILVTVLSLGMLRTFMQTPLYSATVRLQIDQNAAKVVEGGVTPTESNYDYDFLKTQFEILQSRGISERVASNLKLGEDETFGGPTGFSLIGSVRALVSPPPEEKKAPTKADKESAAAGIIQGNTQVRPVAGSRLVDISYTDPNPARAQRVANAVADAYIASNLDKRFQANAYAKTFLEDQLKQLKLRLETSEKALLDFAQKEQIVVLSEKSSIAENNLAAANAAFGTLTSERIKNEQLWRQIDTTDAINLPQFLTNAVIDGLRAKRNALVTEYQEKLETFKPGYPAMVQINNKIKETDRQLATEVKAIKDSYKAAFDASARQESEMKERIEVLRNEALDLQKRLIEYNILKREVETNRSLYEGLLQRYKQVDVAAGVTANNVFIVDSAQMPGAPSSPRLSRALLLSVALGLGAGLAAAYVLEQLDDKVRSAEELEQITGLAILGIIPKVAKSEAADEALADPRSPLSEAYRSLCTSLQFSSEKGLPKTIAVTSTSPSEGKSITSLAVARHFATLGQKVLLIDADLRNPSLHTRMGLDNSIGLSNYLTGACEPPETFQRTQIPNLAFMATGPLPPNAADLLGGTRIHSLLSVGLDVFDLIVVDGPPVMGLADAALLASATSATLFVAGAGQAPSGAVRGALKRLQFTRSHVVGAVLTKFDAKSAGYGYGHDYGYGYGNDRAVEAAQTPQLTQPHLNA